MIKELTDKSEIVLTIRMKVLDEEKKKYFFDVLKADINRSQDNALNYFIQENVLKGLKFYTHEDLKAMKETRVFKRLEE